MITKFVISNIDGGIKAARFYSVEKGEILQMDFRNERQYHKFLKFKFIFPSSKIQLEQWKGRRIPIIIKDPLKPEDLSNIKFGCPDTEPDTEPDIEPEKPLKPEDLSNISYPNIKPEKPQKSQPIRRRHKATTKIE